MHQSIEHAPLADLPTGEPLRAIEGYVRHYLKCEDGPNPSVRLALSAFRGTRHAADVIINVAGDLARAYLAPACGTSLLVYTEDDSIVYRRPPATEAALAMAA